MVKADTSPLSESSFAAAHRRETTNCHVARRSAESRGRNKARLGTYLFLAAQRTIYHEDMVKKFEIELLMPGLLQLNVSTVCVDRTVYTSTRSRVQ